MAQAEPKKTTVLSWSWPSKQESGHKLSAETYAELKLFQT